MTSLLYHGTLALLLGAGGVALFVTLMRSKTALLSQKIAIGILIAAATLGLVATLLAIGIHDYQADDAPAPPAIVSHDASAPAADALAGAAPAAPDPASGPAPTSDAEPAWTADASASFAPTAGEEPTHQPRSRVRGGLAGGLPAAE